MSIVFLFPSLSTGFSSFEIYCWMFELQSTNPILIFRIDRMYTNDEDHQSSPNVTRIFQLDFLMNVILEQRYLQATISIGVMKLASFTRVNRFYHSFPKIKNKKKSEKFRYVQFLTYTYYRLLRNTRIS